MRRGSVSTWEPWARRNSANMAQFTGSRSEFMTSDLGLNDIEYQRKGGCFVSYKKIVLMIVVFVIGLIICGFVGAYFGPLRKKTMYDPLVLTEEDEGIEREDSFKYSASPHIHPAKYNIELTPIFEDSTRVAKLKGRMIIQFWYNGSDPLDHLVLRAKDTTVTRYKLLSLNPSKPQEHAYVRRKRQQPEVTAEAESSSSQAETNVTSNDSEMMTNETIVNSVGNVTSAASLDTITTSSDLVNGTFADVNFNVTDDSSNNATLDGTLSSDDGNSSIFQEPRSPDKPDIKDEALDPRKTPTATNENTLHTMFSNIDIPDFATEVSVKQHETDNVNEIHVILLGTPIQRGVYFIEMDYETLVDGHEIFTANFTDKGRDRWLLATQQKSIFGRRLCPVFDEIRFKARFLVSVARPREMKVLANMPLKSSRNSSNDWMVDVFDETPLLPPNSLAFVESDLVPIGETSVGDPRKAITLWGRTERKAEVSYMLNYTEKITQTFINFFTIDYPMPKMDVVGLPMAVVDGISSSGLITIKESLFYVAEQMPLITKERVLKNLVRLIGEQWLGGLVNVRNWTDVWIIEGSLIYLRQNIFDKIDSTSDSSSFFVADVRQYALDVDIVSRSLQSKLVPTHLDYTEPEILYGKGACLIRMLHNVISDSAFRRGYKKFISRWNNANADSTGFWEAMSESLEVNNLPKDVNLVEAMSSWITTSGYPVITVTRNYDIGSATVHQAQFAYDGSSITDQRLWYVPLTYVVDGGNWMSPEKIWLKQEAEITLSNVSLAGHKSWILFNINGTGCYRVNYDEENWSFLTTFLYSNHEKVPSATRTSLIDDVLSLAREGSTSYSTALNLVQYLREKERHSAPWIIMSRHMFHLNNILYDSRVYANFQEFMLKFISPLYAEVGSKIEEGSWLTLTAIKWACMVEHRECLAWAKKTFADLEKSSNDDNTVPEYLRQTLYCTIAKYGAQEEWKYLLHKATILMDVEERNNILSSFACFQTPWILQTILGEVVYGKRFKEKEVLVILKAFGVNSAASRTIFEFAQKNWKDVVKSYPKSYPVIRSFVIAFINGLTSEQDLQNFQNFKKSHQDTLKIVGRTISIGEARAMKRVSLLKTSLPEIRKWLEYYSASMP